MCTTELNSIMIGFISFLVCNNAKVPEKELSSLHSISYGRLNLKK